MGLARCCSVLSIGAICRRRWVQAREGGTGAAALVAVGAVRTVPTELAAVGFVHPGRFLAGRPPIGNETETMPVGVRQTMRRRLIAPAGMPSVPGIAS
jgi:hypothetical protein